MSEPQPIKIALKQGPNVATDVNTADWHYVAPSPDGLTYTRYKNTWWKVLMPWSGILSFYNADELNRYLDDYVEKHLPLDNAPTTFGNPYVTYMEGWGVGVVYPYSVELRDGEFAAGAAGAAEIESPYFWQFFKKRPEIFLKGYRPRHVTTDGGLIRMRCDAGYDEKRKRGTSAEAEFCLWASAAGVKDKEILGVGIGNDGTANILELLSILGLPLVKLHDQCMGISNGFIVFRNDYKLPVDTEIKLEVRDGSTIINPEKNTGLLTHLQCPFQTMLDFLRRDQSFDGPLAILTGTSIKPTWLKPDYTVSISANNGIGSFTQTVVQSALPEGAEPDDEVHLLRLIQADQPELFNLLLEQKPALAELWQAEAA